jgi:hypothetical protein
LLCLCGRSKKTDSTNIIENDMQLLTYANILIYKVTIHTHTTKKDIEGLFYDSKYE